MLFVTILITWLLYCCYCLVGTYPDSPTSSPPLSALKCYFFFHLRIRKLERQVDYYLTLTKTQSLVRTVTHIQSTNTCCCLQPRGWKACVRLIVNLLGIKLKVFVRTLTDVMPFPAPHPNLSPTGSIPNPHPNSNLNPDPRLTLVRLSQP